MTLWSILDKIIQESPVANFWTISHNLAEGSIVLVINAGFEYEPKDRYLKDVKLDDMIDWP